MLHIFFGRIDNRPSSNSLGGESKSDKFRSSDGAVGRGLVRCRDAGVSSMPKGEDRVRCRLKKAHRLPLSVLMPSVTR